MRFVADIETYPIDDAEQYLEPVEAPGNYKDPEKIAAYIEEARVKALGRCALDPDLCRIVALGWMAEGDTTITVRTCQDALEEYVVLEQFWRDVQQSPIVTFNGMKFDLPVLVRRSQYMRVPHPVVNMDRYRSPHIDLFQKLTFNGAIGGHSLQFYMARFGIPYQDISTGKDIASLVKAGDWDGVRAHCAADVLGTKKLAQRLGLIGQAEPVAEGVF